MIRNLATKGLVTLLGFLVLSPFLKTDVSADTFSDDFNRDEIGSNWDLTIPEGTSIGIVEYPTDGKLRMYHSIGADTPFAKCMTSSFMDASVTFYIDNGNTANQNQESRVWLRLTDLRQLLKNSLYILMT